MFSKRLCRWQTRTANQKRCIGVFGSTSLRILLLSQSHSNIRHLVIESSKQEKSASTPGLSISTNASRLVQYNKKTKKCLQLLIVTLLIELCGGAHGPVNMCSVHRINAIRKTSYLFDPLALCVQQRAPSRTRQSLCRNLRTQLLFRAWND